MAEERTVSRFTKLNSTDRSRQKASTIVNMTKIHQHYRREQPSVISIDICHAIMTILMHYYQTKAPLRPVVRFRDLTKYISVSTTTEASAPTPAPATGSSAMEPILLDRDMAISDPNKATQATDDISAEDDESEIWAAYDSSDDFNLGDHRAFVNIEKFDVEDNDGVDINVPLLLDLLSSDPIEGVPKGLREGAATASAAAGSTRSGPKVFTVEEDVIF